MATKSFTLELTSPVSPAKLFKASVLEVHKIGPVALPDVATRVAIVEGDGGVGSIIQTDFTNAIPRKRMRERYDMLDKDNLECKLELLEGGGIGDKLESGCFHIKVEPAADGGSVYKLRSEVKTHSGKDFGNEDIEEAKKGITNMFKAIEAYVIANPDCV